MKYLKKFNTSAEYTTFKSSDSYVLPNVSFVATGKIVNFQEKPKPKMTIDGKEYTFKQGMT